MKERKPKERKLPPTMHEIARLAGVSQSTVSRVLSGNTAVAPEKYAAVMEVVERLNYRPNVAAQGLVQGKTLAVGILARQLGSPFYGELVRGVTVGLQGSDYYPVISMGGEIGNADYTALDMLLTRRVDALILLYSMRLTDEYIQEIAEHTPVIIVGRQVSALGKNCVCVNNQAGAYAATSYLINKGHTGIAHITGDQTMPDGISRQAGYVQALIDHGIEVDPELIIEGDFTESSGALGVDRLLSIRESHPFSAIFAGNDQTALGARLALFHRQIDVPGDISLIGFDDISSSQYMTPPLTTIRQPVYYMGLMAAKAVLAALIGSEFSLPEFPAELIVRQSVTFARNTANR
jgi:LacI family transcriptional regulator